MREHPVVGTLMCVFLGYQIATIFRCRRRDIAGDSCERKRKACAGGCFKQPSACDSTGLAPFAGHALAFWILQESSFSVAAHIVHRPSSGVNRERRCRCRFVGIADVFPSHSTLGAVFHAGITLRCSEK